MKKDMNRLARFIFFIAIMLAPFLVYADTESSPTTLDQYISDLQKNPSDTALREKIIKLSLTMNPAPAAPKDVIKHEGAAEFAFKNAKTAADFADAAKEYEQALLWAPWLAQDYFNCGVAYEKAGKFADAVRNFNFYLLAAPGAQDTNEVLKRIGGLEYATNKASKESIPEAVVAQDQNKSEDWLKKLDGRRYTCPSENGYTSVIDVRSNVLVLGSIRPDVQDRDFGHIAGGYFEDTGNNRFDIRGHEFSYPLAKLANSVAWGVEMTFIISEDGYKITERTRFSDGDSREYIYLWQR